MSRDNKIEDRERPDAFETREAELCALNEMLEKRVQERTAEAEVRSRQLRALALDLANTESRERKRLAQLLHDNFQQLVSAAKLKTGLVRRTITESRAIEALSRLRSSWKMRSKRPERWPRSLALRCSTTVD